MNADLQQRVAAVKGKTKAEDCDEVIEDTRETYASRVTHYNALVTLMKWCWAGLAVFTIVASKTRTRYSNGYHEALAAMYSHQRGLETDRRENRRPREAGGFPSS